MSDAPEKELPVKWSMDEQAPDHAASARVLLGSAIAVFAILVHVVAIGFVVWVLSLEDGPAGAVVFPCVSTLLVGLVVRSGLRLGATPLGFARPVLARLGLWLAIFFCIAAAGRLLIGMIERDAWTSASVVSAFGLTLVLIAFTVLQLAVLLRSDLIKRSGDLDEGAIL